MENSRKSLHLSVCATDKCNRGCKHCMVSATNNGVEFAKKQWIRKLVREAKELNYVVHGFITGLGEPLMHPKITDLTKGFIGLKVCKELNIITSGFLAKDLEERSRFLELIELQKKCNLEFQLSFNLYSPTFSERLSETLSLLFSQNLTTMSEINIVCDNKNYYKTFHELCDVMACIGVKIGMDINPLCYDYSDPRFKQIQQVFLKQEFNEESWIQLFGDALSISCIYKVSGKDKTSKFFRANVSMTTPLGHAKNLPAGCFDQGRKFVCKDVLRSKNDNDNAHLIMGADGRIFAGCDCLLANLSLGTWETPLNKIILRKNILKKHLMRHILSDNSLNWKKDWPCEECAALAKRNFSFD